MLFPMLNVLYFYVSTFRRKRAVPNMAVVRNSLLLRFLGMFLRYLPNNYGMVLPAPVITGITFVFIFHTRIPPEITIFATPSLPVSRTEDHQPAGTVFYALHSPTGIPGWLLPGQNRDDGSAQCLKVKFTTEQVTNASVCVCVCVCE